MQIATFITTFDFTIELLLYFIIAMMLIHKHKINENYFENSHFKKIKSQVQKMMNDEKKIENVKNRDRNIHFY
jgi:hypothetical protein